MNSNWLLAPPTSARETVTSLAASRPAGFSDDDENYNSDYSDFDFYDNDNTHYPSYQEKNVSSTVTASSTAPVPLAPATPPLLLQPLRYAVIKNTKESVADCLAKLKSSSPEFSISETTLDDDWPVLMFACQTPRTDILRFLIENGADPKHITSEKCTGLIALACAGTQHENFKEMIECAQILIDSGVEVNDAEETLGATALHFAVKNNHTDLVEFLLQHDADIHQLDSTRRTPLHWAASHGFGPIIKILLKYGPDLEILSRSGLCAYEMAALGGFPDTARTLYLYQKAKEDKNLKQVDVNALERNEISTEEKERRKRGLHIYGNFSERSQVEPILNQIKLRMYFPKFEKAGIDLQKFLTMTDKDMVDIGVTNVGHRIKLIEVIRQMHNSDWKRTSLISFPPNSTVTLPDATSFCKNVSYHVDLMSASLSYLAIHANRPSGESTLLNPGLDKNENSRLQDLCKKLAVAADTLATNTNAFHDLINSIKDNPEYKVGDYIGKP